MTSRGVESFSLLWALALVRVGRWLCGQAHLPGGRPSVPEQEWDSYLTADVADNAADPAWRTLDGQSLNPKRVDSTSL